VGKSVASMGEILGRRVELAEAAGKVAAEFGEVFRREIVWKSGEEMGRAFLAAPPSQS